MKRYNKNLGDFGEKSAEEYLKNKGYNILDRNYYVKGGEIDIICMDEDVLVFAEVKTRSSDKFGLPSEAIDKNKAKHMIYAAERYFDAHPLECEIRFDVVEVYAEISDEKYDVLEINHIKNIILD